MLSHIFYFLGTVQTQSGIDLTIRLRIYYENLQRNTFSERLPPSSACSAVAIQHKFRRVCDTRQWFRRTCVSRQQERQASVCTLPQDVREVAVVDQKERPSQTTVSTGSSGSEHLNINVCARDAVAC